LPDQTAGCGGKKETMKKTTVLCISLLMSAAYAQVGDTDIPYVPAEPKFCGHNEAYERLFELYPDHEHEHETLQENFQLEYEEFLETYSPDDRATYIVPVVVHVVHLDGEENISDEQIYDAIAQLNADYSESNVDLGATVPTFAGITGNASFEFRLAKKDPSGNCHSGITRTYSSTTYDTGLSGSGHPIVEAVQDEHGTWPQNKYLNIFVCIDPNGAAGYTFKPDTWYPVGGMYGGIQIRHDYMGIIGTSTASHRHTLSHEVGHWFNLNHCWGNSNDPGDPANCSMSDGVSDTPPTEGWSSCDLSGNTCTAPLDNVQNIMEYSYCSTMFTDGQCARMTTAINSSTAGRSNLKSAANLTATGVNGPGTLCVAQFTSSETMICQGGTVDFTDDSYFNVTGWSWTFEGGTPPTSTDQNPTVTYNTAGSFNVTLQVTDGSDFESVVMNDYVKVMGDPGEPIPYSEGFESLTGLTTGDQFIVYNGNGAEAWAVTSSAASLGSKSAWLDNHGTTDGSVDAFISAPIDLSGIDAADPLIFTFDYAYKKKSSSNNEYLKLYVSKDCGETWSLRENLDSDELNPTVQSTAYTPTTQGEWVTVNVDNITSTHYASNFQYKFEFTNNSGNNIYIDNINIYPESMTDLVDNAGSVDLNVFPNPGTDDVNIRFNAAVSDTYNISLYSPLGAKIATIFNGDVNSGKVEFQYSVASLPSGVYLIQLEGTGETQTIKFVKE
jgi:PKD repeat protein